MCPRIMIGMMVVMRGDNGRPDSTTDHKHATQSVSEGSGWDPRP